MRGRDEDGFKGINFMEHFGGLEVWFPSFVAAGEMTGIFRPCRLHI